jgi:hypothetical protein
VAIDLRTPGPVRETRGCGRNGNRARGIGVPDRPGRRDAQQGDRRADEERGLAGGDADLRAARVTFDQDHRRRRQRDTHGAAQPAAGVEHGGRPSCFTW